MYSCTFFFVDGNPALKNRIFLHNFRLNNGNRHVDMERFPSNGRALSRLQDFSRSISAPESGVECTWGWNMMEQQRQRQQKQMNPEDNLGFIPETPSSTLVI